MLVLRSRISIHLWMATKRLDVTVLGIHLDIWNARQTVNSLNGLAQLSTEIQSIKPAMLLLPASFMTLYQAGFQPYACNAQNTRFYASNARSKTGLKTLHCVKHCVSCIVCMCKAGNWALHFLRVTYTGLTYRTTLCRELQMLNTAGKEMTWKTASFEAILKNSKRLTSGDLIIWQIWCCTGR